MYHLRELRKAKGLKQSELADRLGLAPSTISMYEQGRREPDEETLKAIAKFFDVSTDYLLGHDDLSTRKTPSTISDIIRLALNDYPEIADAIVSADIRGGSINLGNATINIDDIDLDYIKTSILSAIVMAKQKGENGKLEITVSPKAKLPDT